MEAVDKESRLVSSSLRVSVSLGFTRFGFGELSLGWPAECATVSRTRSVGSGRWNSDESWNSHESWLWVDLPRRGWPYLVYPVIFCFSVVNQAPQFWPKAKWIHFPSWPFHFTWRKPSWPSWLPAREMKIMRPVEWWAEKGVAIGRSQRSLCLISWAVYFHLSTCFVG